MTAEPENPLKVFYSYAHKDEKLRNELGKYLFSLKRQGLMQDWYDRDISAGKEWAQEIATHLDTSQIILLLISPDFIASDYCYGIEMQHALEKHETGEARVIPILLRPVDWQDTSLKKLQALPRNGKAVTRWNSKEDAFVEVAKGIREAVKELKLQPSLILPTSTSASIKDLDTSKPQTIDFTVQQGDIISFDTDVVALKYAQQFYGTDEMVASRLGSVGIAINTLAPEVGDYRFVETQGCIGAKHVLFVGVSNLRYFDYPQIRQFSAQVLKILAKVAPHTRRLAMTIHGVGYGLDEIEAVHAQLAGYLDAIRDGLLPLYLDSITIVEFRPDRVNRLRQALEMSLRNAIYAQRVPGQWTYRLIARLPSATQNDFISAPETIEEAGIKSEEKGHAFVAMPFAKEMDDVFYYGIQQPVRSVGLLCERIDQEAFTGDILDRVKIKIETAAVVIAELSGANPNVYLEVGYAWGKGRPTILLVKSDQELRFDVRGQKCLKYERIRDLEEVLGTELKKLLIAQSRKGQDEGSWKRF